MRTKKYIFALAIAVMSCSLEEKSYMQVDDSYIEDTSLAENILLGVYTPMNTDGVYRLNLTMLFDSPNDQIRGEGSSLDGQRTEAANAFSPSSAYVQDTWAGLYKGVYNANSFLEMMEEKMPSMSEKERELGTVFVAEARARSR